ncbi:MAG: hypothetical protein EAZ55_01055 [Cytophagales bacterium]|nr:MAG: hypothetical protein EAZ55_01055 [Cytophagales bacterium]
MNLELIITIIVFLASIINLLWQAFMLTLMFSNIHFLGGGSSKKPMYVLYISIFLSVYVLIMAILFFVQYLQNSPEQALFYYGLMLYGVYVALGLYIVNSVKKNWENRRHKAAEELLAKINISFKENILRLSAQPQMEVEQITLLIKELDGSYTTNWVSKILYEKTYAVLTEEVHSLDFKTLSRKEENSINIQLLHQQKPLANYQIYEYESESEPIGLQRLHYWS